MCSCHSILECCVTFSGVEYKIVCFIPLLTKGVTVKELLEDK